MIFLILYVIVGTTLAMTIGRAIESESEGTGSLGMDFLIDVCVNLFIILFWPLFMLLFLWSAIKYAKKDKENNK